VLPGKGTTVTGVIDRKPMKQAADVLGIKSSAELVRFAVRNRLG